MPRDRAEARVRWRYQQMFTEPWHPGLAQAMDDLVQLCLDHDIPVLGLRMPAVPELQALIDRADLAETRSFYASLGIPIIDLSVLPWHPSHFQDQDHLNATGCLALRELLRPALNLPAR